MFIPLFLSSLNDELVGRSLRIAGLVSLCRQSLAAARMSAGSATFTTTHRVINRVHDNTTVVRTLAEPAAAACLSVRLKVVVSVGDHTYSCAAAYEDHTGLA